MWRVRQYDEGAKAAILESAEPAADGNKGAAAGPVVIPTPLGDKPLTLDVLVES